MTQEPRATPPRREFTDLELDYIREHRPELRRLVAEKGIVNQYLAIAVGVGLVAHIVGYILRSMNPGEPVAFIAEMLYALGFSLWTGVVVVLFVEVLPEAKKRQIVRALAEYDAIASDKKKSRDDRS